jgi:hypothetical protein
LGQARLSDLGRGLRPIDVCLCAGCMGAAGHRHDQQAHPEGRGAPARETSLATAGALGACEPDEAGEAEHGSHEEVQAQAEDVVGRIGAQELFEDAKAGVAGDVEREQTRGADLAVAAEPDQRAGKAKVPTQLIEERRVKCVVGRVAVGTVRLVDLESPRQVGGPPEELLVEVVAYTSDGLGHEQGGCRGIEEARDVSTAAAEH